MSAREGAAPGQAAGVDPSSIAYRVHAHAFNTLTEWLATDQRFVPLSVRDHIATAIVGAIEPLIREDERAVTAAAAAQPAPALNLPGEALAADNHKLRQQNAALRDERDRCRQALEQIARNDGYDLARDHNAKIAKQALDQP